MTKTCSNSACEHTLLFFSSLRSLISLALNLSPSSFPITSLYHLRPCYIIPMMSTTKKPKAVSHIQNHVEPGTSSCAGNMNTITTEPPSRVPTCLKACMREIQLVSCYIYLMFLCFKLRKKKAKSQLALFYCNN